MGGNGWVVREDVAGHEDVGVGGSAAFGSDYMGVVLGCNLVYDADESFVPAIFVVFLFWAVGW